MQQREFTATKTIYLSDEDFYIRVADICVHTEPTNKLAVYRNQEGVGVFNRSLTSMLSMMAAGWLTETAAVVAVAEPVAPTPEPVVAPVVEPEAAPVVEAEVAPAVVEAVVEAEVAPVVVEAVVEPVKEVEAEEPKVEAPKVEAPKVAKKGKR